VISEYSRGVYATVKLLQTYTPEQVQQALVDMRANLDAVARAEGPRDIRSALELMVRELNWYANKYGLGPAKLQYALSEGQRALDAARAEGGSAMATGLEKLVANWLELADKWEREDRSENGPYSISSRAQILATCARTLESMLATPLAEKPAERPQLSAEQVRSSVELAIEHVKGHRNVSAYVADVEDLRIPSIMEAIKPAPAAPPEVERARQHILDFYRAAYIKNNDVYTRDLNALVDNLAAEFVAVERAALEKARAIVELFSGKMDMDAPGSQSVEAILEAIVLALADSPVSGMAKE
jgi:hypothetical protein